MIGVCSIWLGRRRDRVAWAARMTAALSRSFVSRLFSGEREPTAPVLRALSAALDMKAEEMIAGTAAAAVLDGEAKASEVGTWLASAAVRHLG